MKHIVKGVEPHALTQRRAEIQATPGVGKDTYDHLGSTVRNIIKSQCLQEQGFLCAYTGLRIELASSHLEHMWPQSQCSSEEQVDYKNLVACYNGANDKDPGFGAKAKKDWPASAARNLFVRPTDNSCENRFVYQADGHVIPMDADDSAAVETIRRLVLSDEARTLLVEWRRAALEPLLRIEKIDQLRRRIDLLRLPVDAKYEEYAFPKQQVLTGKLKKLEAKVRFARQGAG